VKIYVAASADPRESARVSAIIQLLRADGFIVTCTWPEVVAATPGGSNPRDASDTDRRSWSVTDLDEIDASDAVLFLVPEPPLTTRGAWFESGYAYAGDKHLVFSGDTKQSVFCALGHEYGSDFAAVAKLRELRAS
jgi:nucleoside 2-deoxyribosyltransferase